MDICVMRYFLTVAREGNITKMAEILHVTQPTAYGFRPQLKSKIDFLENYNILFVGAPIGGI